MKVKLSKVAVVHLSWWTIADEKKLMHVKEIINDIESHPYYGVGHPKRLSHKKLNVWSRRIDKKNRVVYQIIDNETIVILRCKGHYDDK